MSSSIKAFIDFSKNLNKIATLEAKTNVWEQAKVAFGREYVNLGHSSKELSPGRIKALKESLDTDFKKVVTKTSTGIKIKVALKSSAEKDKSDVKTWASLLNIGGTIRPKDREFLSVPFSEGPFEIVDYAKTYNGASVLSSFIAARIENQGEGIIRGRSLKEQSLNQGAKKLSYGKTKKGNILLMGKLKGGKWDIIATLVKQVKVPETRWADKFLYNVLRSLKAEL